MIKKLKSKIFFIIMASLSVVILGVIIAFSILNYKNTINTANFMMERFSTNIGEKNDINEKPNEGKIQDLSIEGLYTVIIKNENIVEDSKNTKEIEEYALKVSKENKENGIINKYIYKVRKIGANTFNVTLMENEETITHIRVIIITSIVIAIISIIIIYIIAKKVSETIVKPVQETFEKQKQFISDASHELKTPLAVIEANADVLENEIGNNKWLKYIQNEIESMDKLINELLLLAKTENLESIKSYKNFDFSKEVEIIVSVFESMAYEKKVKINTNIQKDIIMKGNKEDIKHILSTLIDNAIKHTEPEKEVTIELEKEKNEIILQVKNVGNPIPDNERNKIFERFYRIDKARNRNEKRYGLGLAIAKSTVEKYNGKIEVFCKEGITNFKVNIPS